MVKGILGKKIGMTQIFDENEALVPVTLLEAGPCVVQAVKSAEKDGYNAVRLGYADTTEKRLNKPQREELKKNNLKPKKFVREIRMKDKPEVKVGDTVTNSIFKKGDYLDVTGVSKGKGFQGVIKRYGWHGGDAAHGSMFHRAPGTLSTNARLKTIFKGHGLPGHMGHERVTVQNVEVVDVNTENNIMAVKGAVPGANGGYLILMAALKKKAKVAKKTEAPKVRSAAVAPKSKKSEKSKK